MRCKRKPIHTRYVSYLTNSKHDESSKKHASSFIWDVSLPKISIGTQDNSESAAARPIPPPLGTQALEIQTEGKIQKQFTPTIFFPPESKSQLQITFTPVEATCMQLLTTRTKVTVNLILPVPTLSISGA